MDSGECSAQHGMRDLTHAGIGIRVGVELSPGNGSFAKQVRTKTQERCVCLRFCMPSPSDARWMDIV